MVNIDRWPYPPIDQGSIQDDLHVSGPFELFEDDFIHTASGPYQSGGDDRQRSAFFNLPGGSEERFWLLHGVGIESPGERFSGLDAFTVPGSGKPSDRIEKHNDIDAVFDHPFGFLEDHLADLDVP